jgi:hypothetical protein
MPTAGASTRLAARVEVGFGLETFADVEREPSCFDSEHKCASTWSCPQCEFVRPVYCPTDRQLADWQTKPLVKAYAVGAFVVHSLSGVFCTV